MTALVSGRVAEPAVDLQLARMQPVRVVDRLLVARSPSRRRAGASRHAVDERDQAEEQPDQQHDGNEFAVA